MPKDDWLQLAILYDNAAKYSPSNDIAIDRFCESSIRHNVLPVLIGQKDIDRLSSFDGLFIRDTTHPSHYTYEFAIAASMLGIKVIDTPMSIQQGCNKLWQAHLFAENNISHPRTWVERHLRYWENEMFTDPKKITFPCVLKIPDSCFSRGVFKCETIDEYQKTIKKISRSNPTDEARILCQEFIETKYDWRITLFNNQFLFAVKYYMADKDWKIIKYDRKGDYIEGNHECVQFEDIPLSVLAEAEKCNKLLTEGLYGIDIKEVDGKAYVIEINDNPSIDGGVEDEIEGERIYDTIIHYFRQ